MNLVLYFKNMRVISFIMNGNSLTDTDLASLQTSIRAANKTARTKVEYVLYFSKAPLVKSGLKSIVFVHPATKISPIEKAIATASGKFLVFTTINNLLADKQNYLLGQVNTKLILGVPFKVNKVTRLLGVRNLVKTPYLIAEKQFASSMARKFNKPHTVARQADQLLVLTRLAPPPAMFPDHLIRNASFVRPYNIIFRHKVHVAINLIREWRKARIAEKLRRQVKPVVYNPLIPVFIICRDRVEPLKQLVKWCEDEGLKNIIFIDNASTYPPLVEYLSSTPYEVVWLNSNVGHTAPWDAGIVRVYAPNKPFIVTDPDVIPSSDAHGAIKLFCRLLNDHPERTKAGFGLRIDDLPECYGLRDYVLAWEKPFWVSKVEKDVFDAEIDTTFALYRQNTPYVLGPGLRTGGRFVARHEPWYIDSNNPSEEMRYYRSHANRAVGSWGVDANDLSQTYANHMLREGNPSPL